MALILTNSRLVPTYRGLGQMGHAVDKSERVAQALRVGDYQSFRECEMRHQSAAMGL